ncbi:hypothetical protein VP01_1374g4 [Puccinia sorghi]|uniref:Uncharacterized protein n=1 Tax=Puccinia sorghi TaxID=27349 RepID=A0A0L6VNF7_9BASI|nr:hypothetical protein VP01_1374g4 [Puccinia sorghi]
MPPRPHLDHFGACCGGHQHWQGDTKGGATKSTLASKILTKMELQSLYTKASKFLRGVVVLNV